MNAVVKADNGHEVIEQVLIKGDLAALNIEQRNSYYQAVCKSVGLNPLTKPFEYIQLNGKLRLYALKDCTDQLRSIHGISVTELVESEREGVFIVKAKVCNKDGRTDVSTGAVNITGLKGEALANALMKSETKAKRRATLSICGLGMLDETEVEDIPPQNNAPRDSSPPRRAEAVVQQIEPPKETARPTPKPSEDAPHKIVGGTYAEWTTNYIEAIGTASDPSTVMAWIDANQQQLAKLAKGSPSDSGKVKVATDKHLAFLRNTDPITSGPQGEPQADMGGDVAPKVDKPPRGRPKASKEPSFDADYDGWLAHQISSIAKAETPEAIEAIFERIDAHYADCMPPDKESLLGARRDAEARLEQ